MKLIRCTIENFGGLHQRSFEFDAGLTAIEQPNGSGKTTLATFIRCMLYGMPARQRANDLAKNLRRRYAPWQGGAYGGQLIIQAHGRMYRIERSFGSAPKEDTLAVFDQVTGKRTDELGDVPGIALFGLDADSFERSAYIPQNRLQDALATADIKAKLGNLVDNTDNTRNYETAMEALRDARRKLVPMRGSGGVHAKLVDEITQVNEELTQLSTSEGELERVRDRETRLSQVMEQQQGRLEQVRAGMTEATQLRGRRNMALECKRLDDAYTQANQAYEEAAAAFAYGIPSEDEIQRVVEARQCLNLVKQAGITQEDINAFARAEASGAAAGGVAAGAAVVGGAAVASDGVAAGGTRVSGAAAGGAAAAAAAGGESAGRNIGGGGEGYAGARPNGGGANGTGSADDAGAAAHVLPAQENAEAGVSHLQQEFELPGKKPSGAVGMALVVVGVLLLLVGVVAVAADALNIASVFPGQLYVGFGAAVVGAALCTAGAFLHAKHRKQQAYQSLYAASGAAYAGDAHPGVFAGARTMDESAVASMDAAGTPDVAGAGHAAHSLQEMRANREDLLRRACDAEDEIRAFCKTYHVASSNLTRENVRTLRDNVRQVRELSQHAESAKQTLAQFVDANGACAWRRSDEERFRSLNLQELQHEEKRLIAEQDDAMQKHAKDLQRMQVLQERVQKIPQLNDHLHVLVARRKKVENDVRTLDAAIHYMEQAKDQLCANYAIPMQQAFQRYLTMAVGENGAIDVRKSQIDSDFSMTFAHAGATREKTSLSAGYADVVMVCMRMALCDVLYEKERPFIIMDDPFANVDDDLMQRAYQLLEKLSEHHQIIYLTCSNSRNPLAG